MPRFTAFWRSLAAGCEANENECRDSDGKRVRSSADGRGGEIGPKAFSAFSEDLREGAGERFRGVGGGC